MFKGSLPKDALKIIFGLIKNFDTNDIYVGCSGNFSIERTIEPLKKRLHSNDVSIYSSALGWFFSGTKFSISVRDRYEEEFGWLTPYMQNELDTVATIMLCSDMLEGYHCKDAYFTRIRAAYKAQWESLHKVTVHKLSPPPPASSPFRVDSFFCGDVLDFIDTVPDDSTFVSFPPFWDGGYEKLNRHLDEVFEWSRPEYPILTQERINSLIEKITSKRNWVLGTATDPHSLPDSITKSLTQFHLGECKTVSKGKPIHIFASSGTPRRIGPKMGAKTVSINRLKRDSEIGEHLEIIRLSNDEFNSIRSQYLGANIVPCNAPIAFGVTVSGLLIGCFALNTVYRGLREPPEYSPHVYIFSDFAVAPTKYPRLSKLVLYAALSSEAKHIAEQLSKKRINGAITTAFSKNPISMKYRGLFDVHSRVFNEETKEYRISYNAPMGRWSLVEALDIWKKKHGHTSDIRNVTEITNRDS